MAGQGPWKGKPKPDLVNAIEAAWEAAKGDVPSGSTLVVDQITFVGTNPISEYIVVVKEP